MKGLDFALEAGDLEDPFLATDGFKDGVFSENEDHVPCRDEHELGKWATDPG